MVATPYCWVQSPHVSKIRDPRKQDWSKHTTDNFPVEFRADSKHRFGEAMDRLRPPHASNGLNEGKEWDTIVLNMTMVADFSLKIAPPKHNLSRIWKIQDKTHDNNDDPWKNKKQSKPKAILSPHPATAKACHGLIS